MVLVLILILIPIPIPIPIPFLAFRSELCAESQPRPFRLVATAY